MRVALVVAVNELRRRSRDRSAWVLAFVAPLVLATIITSAIGSGDGFDVTLLVVDADRSDLSTPLVDGLLAAGEEQTGGITFRRARTPDEAAEALRDDDGGAALVVPKGFGASLQEATPRPLQVLRHPERPVAGAVARAVADGIAARVDAGRLAVRTVLARAGETGTTIDQATLAGLGVEAGATELPVTVEQGGVQNRLDLVAYFAPSMGIIFLFFTVGYGARTVLAERQQGTLTRLRSAPISGASLLAGKAIASFVLGFASLMSLWVITSFAFGASWGDPLGIVVLCAATVLAVAGITAVLATFAKTEEQVASLSAMVTFGLALLGGNFVTPGAMPDLLRRLSLLTPNGWALRGFTELAAQGAAVGDVGTIVAVLVGLAVATGLVAAVRAPGLVSA